jgi:hypothetical protein
MLKNEPLATPICQLRIRATEEISPPQEIPEEISTPPEEIPAPPEEISDFLILC